MTTGMTAPGARPAPRRVDYEEFLHSPVGALRRYTDRDARPLCGEAVVNDPAFRATLEQRRCHYAGSRHDHPLPMNLSALKQMTRNWDAILATASALRAMLAGPGSAAGGLVLGMRVAYAGVCLPLYLLYRADDAMGDGRVPGFVSGLHKASIDIATSIQLLLLESFHGDDGPAPWSHGGIQDLLDFVEREGLLVGQRGVCAGPPHLIRELLEVMLDGRGGRRHENRTAVAELGDLGGLRAYVDELTAIWVGKHVVGACNARLLDALDDRARAAGLDSWRVREVDAQIREHRTRESHPVLVSNVVARQERAIRSLDGARFHRLLQAIGEAAGSLAGPGGRRCARDLLDHAGRQSAASPPVTSPELEPLLDGRVPDFVLAALLDAARMEQLALRFFASTEPNLRAALGTAEAARTLSSRDLAAVFGVLPREHIGAAIGAASSVDAQSISFRAAGGADMA